MTNPMQSDVEVVRSRFKHDENEAVLCNQNVEIKFDGTTLRLAQSWENGEELAPIFSGACWAGTVVWQAALDLCDYMSKHLRNELVGANVVELGCGIGVPSMIARLLGATVVLTEQDELLGLLEGNLNVNFPGDDGIRWAALDWEREEDTDALLASYHNQQPSSSSSVPCASGDIAVDGERDGASSYSLADRKEGGDQEGDNQDTEDSSCASRQRGVQRQEKKKRANGSSGEERYRDSRHLRFDDGNAKTSNGARCSESGRLDFILCADCVFEPLYGDSWKALAKVIGRLSDSGTTVLASVERRGVDGVSNFLEACRAQGFAIRMVYLAGPDAPAPVELFELCKGGAAGLRGAEGDGNFDGNFQRLSLNMV